MREYEILTAIAKILSMHTKKNLKMLHENISQNTLFLPLAWNIFYGCIAHLTLISMLYVFY